MKRLRRFAEEVKSDIENIISNDTTNTDQYQAQENPGNTNTEINPQPNPQPQQETPKQQPVEQNPAPTENNDESVAVDLLKRIDESVENIKDAYYSMLDNLNALNSAYPNVYGELKYMIKFPSETEVKGVAQLQMDVSDAVKYLSDPEFLKGFMGGHGVKKDM